MEIILIMASSIFAFFLGSCPFALWIGTVFLHKDIRNYGDGNPGTTNVFKAGGPKWGCLALILEIAKGFPFVYLADAVIKLPDIEVLVVAISAMLGHAFSPFLRFQGGKALAITLGILLALPSYEKLVALVIFTALGFLFIKSDAWIVIFGAASTFIYLLITRADIEELLLMFLILILWTTKQYNDLKIAPILKIRPVSCCATDSGMFKLA